MKVEKFKVLLYLKKSRLHPVTPRTLFSPIFSLAREKMGPPEATSSRKSAATLQSAYG